MKTKMLLLIMLGAMPLSMMAQDDDMYFVPKKQKTAAKPVSSYTVVETSEPVYVGSSRSVDDYNRRGSDYEVLPDSDIISFDGVQGVYPDSVGDFSITKKMSRWEEYTPSQAYWEGYSDATHDSWSWHSPWYYTSYYPWYDSWYDPWYYGYYGSWRYGWYDPWYWDYGWGYRGYYSSWYHPWYYGGGWYGGGYAHYSGRYNRNTIAGGTRDRYGNHHGTAYNGRSATYSGGRSVGSGSRTTTASSRTYNNGSRTYSSGTRTYNSGVRTSSGTRSYSSGSSSSGTRSYSSGSSSSSSRSYSSGSSSSSSSRSYSSGSSSSSRSYGGGGGGGRSGGSGGSRSGGRR